MFKKGRMECRPEIVYCWRIYYFIQEFGDDDDDVDDENQKPFFGR
jgi:hypothetical protein